MKTSRISAAWCLLPLLLADCASPTKPVPPAAAPPVPEDPVAAAARKDERQKIMQEYWYEHTVAAEAGERAGPAGPPPLLYPAGSYGGINFAPRQTAEPSLAEPVR